MLSGQQMDYDVIFYDKDCVFLVSYGGESKDRQMIAGFRGRLSGGNRMVAVSATNVEMHDSMLVV